MRALVCPLLLAALLAGCVFRDAAEPRFFRPQSSLLAGTGDDAASSAAQPVLRWRQPRRSTPLTS